MKEATASKPSLWSAVWERRRDVLRAWLWFVGSLAVLIQLLIWARPFTDKKLTTWIASACAVVLRLLGADGRSQETMLTSSMGTFEIVRECTGVYPTTLFIAAVLAYPTSWMRKLLGVALGIVAIQFANIVRVVSLVYIRHWYPDAFETAHLVVWQALIVFITVLFWLVWAVELAPASGREAD